MHYWLSMHHNKVIIAQMRLQGQTLGGCKHLQRVGSLFAVSQITNRSQPGGRGAPDLNAGSCVDIFHTKNWNNSWDLDLEHLTILTHTPTRVQNGIEMLRHCIHRQQSKSTETPIAIPSFIDAIHPLKK